MKLPPHLAAWRREHLPGVPSKVDRDPDVQDFVRRHIVSMTFSELAAACREKFGPERAPSRSSLHRYWLRRRFRRYPPWPEGPALTRL